MRCVSTGRLLRPPVTSLGFLQEPTDDGQKLVGAAVGEEAAHGVLEGEGQGERRHTLLAVLIGLQERGEGEDKLGKHLSVGYSDTCR